MKKILNSYNKQDAVLVITSYPSDSKKTAPYDAIAAYSKHVLAELSKTHSTIVMAERENRPSVDEHTKKLSIYRIWKKGNILSFIQMFIAVLKLNRIKTIYVPFEFNVFGGTTANIVLLMILAVNRLLGKRIVFEAHQIIENVADLQNHINIHNRLLLVWLNWAIRQYYRAIGIVSNNVIVFEEDLKQRLNGLIPLEKVQVIAQPYTQQKAQYISGARIKLGIKATEFVVLFFGFLNWYKGVDWLVESLKNVPKDARIRLIVAGGANPYHKSRAYYQKYLNSITQKISEDNRMIYTDFIPDNKISFYFSAADLMVMPYRVFMSASGPFSMALSHRIPVILSEKLERYSRTEDFAYAMKEANINGNELFFPLNKRSLIKLIEKAKNNDSYYKKLEKFVTVLSNERTIKKVSEKLQICLFPRSEKAYKLSPRFVLQS